MFVLKNAIKEMCRFGDCCVACSAGQEIDLVSSWVPEPNWKIPVLHG